MLGLILLFRVVHFGVNRVLLPVQHVVDQVVLVRFHIQDIPECDAHLARGVGENGLRPALLEAELVEHTGHFQHKIGVGEGLEHIVEGPDRIALDGKLGQRGHEQQKHRVVQLAQAPGRVHAFDVRHLDVHEDDLVIGRIGVEKGHRIGKHAHLALHETEKDLLKLIADSGKFGKTVVVINSAYPMEMGWIYDEQYGVDAALWIGTPGLKGFSGVAKVLTGKAAPSGRLVDTWAASSLSSAAAQNANAVNGADAERLGCYVFDAGDYVFAIGSDAHDALNNVLALTNTGAALTDTQGNTVSGDANKARSIHLDETDNVSYARSIETGEIVANRFEKMDLNYWQDGAVTYLTRADWNTFPEAVNGVELSAEMAAVLTDDSFEVPADAPAYTDFAVEEDHGIKFADMVGVAYDDPKWDEFLDQLSVAQMTSIVGENFGQPSIDTVSKPANANSDGPAGPQGSYPFGENYSTTVHVGEAVAAATWNTDILAARGSFIAEDCLFVGTTQLWSPGANLHRTPFSGRNFEYYSEDSVLSYLMGAAETAAMQAKGLNAAIKHFVANDQETNRAGLCTFASEQGFRQNSLKGFEGAFTKGGALGTMMSFNRIGLQTMYQNAETATGVLRDEWGFKGVTITDSVKGAKDVYTVACLVAGTDTFNADTGRSTELLKYLVKNKDGYVLQQLRRANRNYYYAMANSNLVNGLSREAVVQDFVPWWQTTLKAIDIGLGVLTACFAVLFVLSLSKKQTGRKNG